MNDWSLMKYVRGGGCASKIGPGELSSVLCEMKAPEDGNVIVGMGGFEDAGVYKISDDLAVVQTVDFLTPVVQDPRIFGRIAAANALSDVYAMGATPKTAMNLVCFAPKLYDLAILKEIIKGGIDKMREAGVSLIGGHSVDDAEIKYGLSVTGIVHPARIIRNEGAHPGDLLVLTKPLGTGIIVTAIKESLADEHTTAKAIDVMTQLNNKASLIMQKVQAHAATDVTGFGLIGHLLEMIKNSVGVELNTESIPYIHEAGQLLAFGTVGGGLRRNKEFYGSNVDCTTPGFPVDLLYDPQTSGGMIFAIDPDTLSSVDGLAREMDQGIWVIGRFIKEPKGRVVLA